jgi:mRNA interferase MazF
LSAIPTRGEVWRAELDPVRGHEQGRVRPVVVASNNVFNRGPGELVTIVPITSKFRPIRAYLRINPPEGGLPQISYIICDQIRTISRDRLSRRLGVLSKTTMAEVDERLKLLLALS